MSDRPAITVLMPVRNGRGFVHDAMDSILAQSWQDWEMVIVDDGSTDGTDRVLAQYAGRDPRIRLLSMQVPSGLKEALNAGLVAARGTWIARQDADDTSRSERLSTQMAVLEAGSILVLGSGYTVTGLDGSGYRVQSMPHSDTAIRWRMLFDNPFSHTSIMFARLFPDGTPVRYESRYCEDYDLWTRMLARGKGMNLPQALVTRREHAATYTIREKINQTAERNRIACREMLRVEPAARLTPADAERLHGWFWELPSVLGPDDLLLASKLARLLRGFARLPNVERGEAGSIAADWHGRILASVPDHRYRLAWRMGLMRTLFLSAPGRVTADLRRRIRARAAVRRANGGGKERET